MKTTILLVDDHPAIRVALRSLLQRMLGVGEVLDVDNGQSAVDVAREKKIDLVILDLELPKMGGLDVLPRLKNLNPETRILVLSAQDPGIFAPRVLALGASGFVSKTQELTELARAAEAVLAGYTVFPAEATSTFGRHKETSHSRRIENLTNKELRIFQMLAKGMSNKEIGEVLYISNKTVSSHKIRIMAKLSVKTLVELAALARQHNL